MPDGRRLQVKCRLIEGRRRLQYYSPIRSWDFEACVFVQLDGRTYEVLAAVEVPVEQVQMASSWSGHVNGSRLSVGTDLVALPGAKDVTNDLRRAMDTLDSSTSSQPGELQISTSRPSSGVGGTAAVPPTTCLCGCGAAVAPGRFFVASHDRRAEAQIIREQYGSIADFVLAHRDGTRS